MSERTQRRTDTHRRIIDAAGRLFCQHGIDGIGVDAIMREAGLTHGGFYAHFASKEALVTEVSRALLEKSAARWSDYSATRDKAEALHRIVEPYLSPVHLRSGTGCPLTTLGTEAARRSAMRHAMDRPLQDMLAALETCMPDPSRAPAALAIMVGAVTLARLADDPALAERFLAAAAETVLTASPDRGAPASDDVPADDTLPADAASPNADAGRGPEAAAADRAASAATVPSNRARASNPAGPEA